MTIATKNKIVTLSILKIFFIFLSKRPCNLNNKYDLENYGVIDNDEEYFMMLL
jgi:hypothetical protein